MGDYQDTRGIAVVAPGSGGKRRRVHVDDEDNAYVENLYYYVDGLRKDLKTVISFLETSDSNLQSQIDANTAAIVALAEVTTGYRLEYRSTGQQTLTLANTPYGLLFANGVDTDPTVMTRSGSTFTAQKDGCYLIQIVATRVSATGNFFLWVNKNGDDPTDTTLPRYGYTVQANSRRNFSTTTLDLAIGETFDAYIQSGAAGDQSPLTTVTSDENVIIISKLC